MTTVEPVFPGAPGIPVTPADPYAVSEGSRPVALLTSTPSSEVDTSRAPVKSAPCTRALSRVQLLSTAATKDAPRAFAPCMLQLLSTADEKLLPAMSEPVKSQLFNTDEEKSQPERFRPDQFELLWTPPMSPEHKAPSRGHRTLFLLNSSSRDPAGLGGISHRLDATRAASVIGVYCASNSESTCLMTYGSVGIDRPWLRWFPSLHSQRTRLVDSPVPRLISASRVK